MDSIEKKLKESEEKYRTLTEQSFLGIAILQDDIIQYVNKQLAYTVGYTVEEIMAWEKGGFLNFIYPEDRKFIAKQARKKQSGESDVINQYQFRGIRKNGDIIWLEVFSKTINYKGKPADFVTIHDITDKKTSEQKIKESEEKYRSLFDNMNAGFAYHKVIVDENNKPIDYQYLEVNPAFEKLTGLKADQMIGKKVTEILPGTENDPADWIGKFGNVGLTGNPLTVEDYSEALDRWYKVSGYSPKKGYFAVTFTDITEQKKAELIIAESEEKYRSLFNNIPFAIILFTIEGTILDCNDAINLITGYSRKELIGNNFKDFNFYVDTPSAGIKKRERQIQDGKIPSVREILLHKKDGSQFWGRSQIKFMKLQNQTYIQAIIQDITESKNIEKQISDLAKFPSENPNPVLRVNNKKIIYINKAGRDLFGLMEESKIPDTLEDNIINAFDENIIKTLEVKFNDEYYSFSIMPIIIEGYANVYGTNITDRKRSEIALNLEKKFADDIFNSSTDTIFVFNPETGKAIRWNNGFSEVSGYTNEEISKLKAPNSYYNKEDLENAAEAIKNVMTTGKTTLEMFLITKDGRKIPYEYTATTLEDFDGNILIVSVGRDLTERKEAEKEIQYQASLVENVNDAILSLDLDFNIQSWNNAAEKIYGWEEKEVLGKNLNDVIPVEFPNDDNEKVVEQFFKNGFWKGEGIQYHKNGTKLIILSSSTFLTDNSGNRTGMVTINHDNSEYKKAEERLRESEAKFRGIFETIPDIFFLISSDGTILDYKGTIEELYVPPEEFLGKKIFNVLPESIAELSQNMLKKTLETHEPQTIEYNLNIQGETHFYEARHLYFPEDKVLAFIRDITERRKAEEKLLISERKYREAFDRANFYKDLFTHDISNILQVVNSSAELISYQLGDSDKSKDIVNIAGIIRKQVERGSKLVSNVRTLSRIDEEQIPTKTLEISRILENSIDFVEKAYEERNVKITIEGLKGKYNANANELIQDVFENILINSTKYNENSNVEITVRISKIKIDKQTNFKIEFIDNGIGVPDDRKKAIFLSGNREFKGSKGMGLGLSLVSKIVQIFNGKIWVEDKVKGDYTQGSNLILLLPEAK
jgi:PAS domain S-box-containing protein